MASPQQGEAFFMVMPPKGEGFRLTAKPIAGGRQQRFAPLAGMAEGREVKRSLASARRVNPPTAHQGRFARHRPPFLLVDAFGLSCAGCGLGFRP